MPKGINNQLRQPQKLLRIFPYESPGCHPAARTFRTVQSLAALGVGPCHMAPKVAAMLPHWGSEGNAPFQNTMSGGVGSSGLAALGRGHSRRVSEGARCGPGGPKMASDKPKKNPSYDPPAGPKGPSSGRPIFRKIEGLANGCASPGAARRAQHAGRRGAGESATMPRMGVHRDTGGGNRQGPRKKCSRSGMEARKG